MKIIEVTIHNYRNLDGITISLSDDCNFIVGENNLGKSNFLSMLDIIFNRRSFDANDFNDVTKPIEVNLKLRLSEIEVGHFSDLFNADDYTCINITCSQIDPDDLIEFFHTETKTYIHPSLIRCINYVLYNSLRNPTLEINFDRGRGVGRFLNKLISNYLKDNDLACKDFLESSKVDELANEVNEKLSKVKSFKDFGISATPDDDLENLLSKLLVLKDGKGGNLSRSGYGIQFLILVTLSILEKIQSIMQQRKDKGIFQDETTGEKSISLVLGLDEPEIHLHPYMQRSLIKYLCAIVSNQNKDFSQLVKELFDIDKFIGQNIVVTQSPNMILNDYRQIVRFCSKNDLISVVSGTKLDLTPQLINHLYLNFPFIKEAFFSRCAIFVEGATEYSCLPLMAQKLTPPSDFDDLGICIIQARGNAIPQLITLSSLFEIPSVGITDKDDGLIIPVLPNHFQTNLRNFEEELVSIIDKTGEPTLRKIIQQYDPQGINAELQFSLLNKWAFEKYSATTTKYTKNVKLSDIKVTDFGQLKAFYLTWFSHNKSYPLGKLIGETISGIEVPAPYMKTISEAIRLI